MEVDGKQEGEEKEGDEEAKPVKFIGYLRPGPGKWASCIRLIDATQVMINS